MAIQNKHRSIEILIATHKDNRFAMPEHMRWIQVNARAKGHFDGYLYDDEGVNISQKNASYCELTALYTLWKTRKSDICGLFHYRRFLGNDNDSTLKKEAKRAYSREEIRRNVISTQNIIEYLEKADIIFPVADMPFPTTAFEDLQRFVSLPDIRKLIEIIEEYYPFYVDALYSTLYSYHISYCNMFIARRKLISGYCEWLFDVLKKCEEQIDIGSYDTNHMRIWGYFGEILLNVYVKAHQLRIQTVDMLNLDETSGIVHVKQTIKEKYNALKTLIGKYPARTDKELWEARFLCRCGLLRTPTFNDETALMNAFKLSGGVDVDIKKDEHISISGRFGGVSIIAYWCESYNEIEQIVESTNRIITSFGKAMCYRLYVQDMPQEITIRSLLKKGFLLFSTDNRPSIYSEPCIKQTVM